MQQPANLELKWYEGMTNSIPLALYSDAARTTPININGVRWIFEARGSDSSGSVILLRKDSLISGEIDVPDVSLGALTINIIPADTLGQTWKTLNFSVIGIWPSSGPTLCYFIGDIDLEPAIATVS